MINMTIPSFQHCHYKRASIIRRNTTYGVKTRVKELVTARISNLQFQQSSGHRLECVLKWWVKEQTTEHQGALRYVRFWKFSPSKVIKGKRNIRCPLMLQVSSSFSPIHTATTVAQVLKPAREACHKGFLHPRVTAPLYRLRNSEPASLPGALFRPGGQLFLHMKRKDCSSAHTIGLLALEIVEAQKFLMHGTSTMISKMCPKDI